MMQPLKPVVKFVIGIFMFFSFPLWIPLVLIAGVAWVLGEAAQCLGEAVGLLEKTPEVAMEEDAWAN